MFSGCTVSGCSTVRAGALHTEHMHRLSALASWRALLTLPSTGHGYAPQHMMARCTSLGMQWATWRVQHEPQRGETGGTVAHPHAWFTGVGPTTGCGRCGQGPTRWWVA